MRFTRCGGYHTHCPQCHLTFRLHSNSPAWRYCENDDNEFVGKMCKCGEEKNNFRKRRKEKRF